MAPAMNNTSDVLELYHSVSIQIGCLT